MENSSLSGRPREGTSQEFFALANKKIVCPGGEPQNPTLIFTSLLEGKPLRKIYVTMPPAI